MLQRPDVVEEHLYKVLVIGDASTGKTSFIKRYVHQFFSRAYKATIGIDFAFKNIQLDDKTLIRLQLWDIAGQERFVTMTRAFYRDAFGAFIVYDVTSKSTFDSVIKWKQDLDNKVSSSDGSNIPCMLLANKCDLAEQADIDEHKLREFAREYGFSGYAYTSPKDNVNIDNAVLTLVKTIYRKHQLLDDEDNSSESGARRRQNGIKIKGQSYFSQGLKQSCCGSS